MSSHKFNVGQIAYIIYNKKKLIIPVKIIEQIVRVTESEQLIDWKLQTPDSENSLLVSQLQDSIYSSLDEAKQVLLQNAKSTISKMGEACLNIQHKTWPHSFITPSNNPLDTNDNKINNLVTNNKNLDKIKITLSDGTVANIAPNNDFFDQEQNENITP